MLVAVAMLLFLHSFRNSLIVLISIPTSLVATFIVMYLMGFTLNLMTLLGLSLVVGILVDAKSSVEGGNPEIHILPDRSKMAALGISSDMLGAALSNAFNGNQDAKFKKGNNEWDINIRLTDFDRKN
ncbi:MAG: efflux RND transporter permease subunit, partial [Bacteroidales bacterium]|nr:efflux RND transporter permease subunit [Bacteroidales bacterium]